MLDHLNDRALAMFSLGLGTGILLCCGISTCELSRMEAETAQGGWP